MTDAANTPRTAADLWDSGGDGDVLHLKGPVAIAQSDVDPGDMGEPRVFESDGTTYVTVPSFHLWSTTIEAEAAAPTPMTMTDPVKLRQLATGKRRIILASEQQAILALLDELSRASEAVAAEGRHAIAIYRQSRHERAEAAAPTPAELPRTRGDGTVAYEPSDEPAEPLDVDMDEDWRRAMTYMDLFRDDPSAGPPPGWSWQQLAWAFHARAIRQQGRLAEAAAPTPATGNASKRNPVPPRINVVADTPTPAEPHPPVAGLVNCPRCGSVVTIGMLMQNEAER